MDGTLGFILLTFIIYVECFGGNNDTNSGITNKIMLNKCCPEGQYLLKYTMRCRTSNLQWQNRSLPNIPLYRYIDNEVPVLSDKKFYDVYEINVPANETFDRLTWYDFSGVNNHHFFLSDAAKLIYVVPNEYHWLLQIDTNNFCVDLKLLGKANPPQFVVVSHQESSEIQNNQLLVVIGFLVSSFFMALVLTVYFMLPELRNLSGMVLMNYVSSLLGAFFIMAILQFRIYTPVLCRALSSVTYFLFMSSFCWMNVMSMDIWWTFRGYAQKRSIHRRGVMFKFCMYCLYGYGVPVMLTVFVVVMYFIDLQDKPWFVTPGSINSGCFMGDDGKFFYQYVPMLILILSNWLLFLMTAFNIWRLHWNTAVLDSGASGTPAAHRIQQYRFMVYLKLSIVMSINWILEVISSINPNFKGWYISDVYNLLMGFFIFVIFVCKKNILRKIVKKLKGDNAWQFRRKVSQCRSSKSGNSASSHISETDISQNTPLQICNNPKGQLSNS